MEYTTVGFDGSTIRSDFYSNGKKNIPVLFMIIVSFEDVLNLPDNAGEHRACRRVEFMRHFHVVSMPAAI